MGVGGVLLIVAIVLQTGDLLPAPALNTGQGAYQLSTSNITLTSGKKIIIIIVSNNILKHQSLQIVCLTILV